MVVSVVLTRIGDQWCQLFSPSHQAHHLLKRKGEPTLTEGAP